MRTLYKKQQEELLQLLEKQVGKYITIAPSDTGIHLIGWLKHPCDMELLLQKAAAANIIVHPVQDFTIRFKQPQGLLLGFTGFQHAEMEQAVLKLKRVLSSL